MKGTIAACRPLCAGALLATMLLVISGAPSRAWGGEPKAARHRNEWFALELSFLALTLTDEGSPDTDTGLAAFGPIAHMRIATLKWSRVYWTTFELGGSFLVGGETLHLYAGTQVGLPFYLSPSHQLQVGLGVGMGIMAIASISSLASGRLLVPPLWSPTVRYTYLTTGRTGFGVTARAMIPTLSGKGSRFGAYALILSFDIGWSEPAVLAR